jgi:UDP-N-acetylglucosamine acyltransferase
MFARGRASEFALSSQIMQNAPRKRAEEGAPKQAAPSKQHRAAPPASVPVPRLLPTTSAPGSMARRIHPTAIVDASAEIGENVSIGAYSVIGANVRIGDGCDISNHVTILGSTRIGPDNRFFSYSSIGQDPQDKKYHGEANSHLEIGTGNTFREYVTVNRGSDAGGGWTRVGDENWIMALCHIAHDCTVGNRTVFANGTTLAGHVKIGDGVTLGGFTAIHQFCSVGELAITGGLSKVTQDIPPFVTADGNPLAARGINKIGLERNGVSSGEIEGIERAYRIFYRSHLTAKEAVARLDAELDPSAKARRFAEFVQNSKRGVVR